MALKGLTAEIQEPQIELPFQNGEPNITEAVGVSVEALRLLRVIEDIDAATESITDDFIRLAKLGYNGRLHVLPRQTIPFDHIVSVAEDQRASGVKAKYVYPNLWTPGTEDESYTEADLNAGPEDHQSRLAVFSDTLSSYDPVLHFRGLPYDDEANQLHHNNAPYKKTQLGELEEVEQGFQNLHPENTINPLDHRAFAMLALMDRIRGKKPSRDLHYVDPRNIGFILLNRGWMRIPSLGGSRNVDGGSFVGYVGSSGSQSFFGGSGGRASRAFGVGLSLGLLENPKVS